MMRLQNVVKLYHWSTHNYSKHVASEKLYSDLQTAIDKFIEIYIVKACTMSRLDMLTEKGIAMRINMYNDITFVKELDNYANTMSTGFVADIIKGTLELENVRDDILGIIQNARYLLTMR